MAEHCLSLDMSFHKTQTSGSLIERVDGDVNALANFFSSFIIHLFGNLLLMIGILALLYRENFWIGFVMTVFVVGDLRHSTYPSICNTGMEALA